VSSFNFDSITHDTRGKFDVCVNWPRDRHDLAYTCVFGSMSYSAEIQRIFLPWCSVLNYVGIIPIIVTPGMKHHYQQHINSHHNIQPLLILCTRIEIIVKDFRLEQVHYPTHSVRRFTSLHSVINTIQQFLNLTSCGKRGFRK